jgi:tetratricopeptide (TPR) repeat protein
MPKVCKPLLDQELVEFTDSEVHLTKGGTERIQQFLSSPPCGTCGKPYNKELCFKQHDNNRIIAGGICPVCKKGSLQLVSMGCISSVEDDEEELKAVEEKFGSDHPEVVQTIGNLARNYARHQRYAEAEPLFKRAVTITEKAFGPDHREVVQSLYSLALFYHQVGRYSEAETLYKRVLMINEKALGRDYLSAPTTHINLAGVYINQGKYQDAIAVCKEAIKIMPHYVEAYNMLGNTYEKSGQYQDAIDTFKQALTFKPDCKEAYNNLGYTYDELGKHREAIDAYKQALTIDPGYATAHYNLACAYSILGEKENACESLKTAVARGFSNIELLKNDADLINIRENKCYKKILRGLEASFDFAR